MRNRECCWIAVVVLCIGSVSAWGQPSFPRFNFNVGGGLGVGRGAVGSFVGNSYFGVAGGGVNLSRMFGVNAEYMYYDLNIRPSVNQSQALGDTSGSLQSVSLNGIVRPPVHLGRIGFYGIFGIGFYRRSETSNRGLIPALATCQPSWVWWDIACSGFPPQTVTAQNMGSFSKDAGGFNYGGGITRSLNHLHNAKIYFEFRYHRAYQSDVQTSMMPISFGLRW